MSVLLTARTISKRALTHKTNTQLTDSYSNKVNDDYGGQMVSGDPGNVCHVRDSNRGPLRDRRTRIFHSKAVVSKANKT